MHTKWKSDFFRNLSNGGLTRLASGCFVDTMVSEPPQNIRQHVSESPRLEVVGLCIREGSKPLSPTQLPVETEPGRRQNKTIPLLW